MQQQKLTSEHPLYKKVQELEDLATKLNIRITTGTNGQIIIEDTESDLAVEYRDIEQTRSGYETTSEFPYFAEWKLIIIE